MEGFSIRSGGACESCEARISGTCSTEFVLGGFCSMYTPAPPSGVGIPFTAVSMLRRYEHVCSLTLRPEPQYGGNASNEEASRRSWGWREGRGDYVHARHSYFYDSLARTRQVQMRRRQPCPRPIFERSCCFFGSGIVRRDTAARDFVVPWGDQELGLF